MKEILKVTGLNVNYGAIHAIHDVSLTVNEGWGSRWVKREMESRLNLIKTQL